MIGRSADWLLAIAGGVLLALMIEFNSLLAKFTSPVYASWVAHGLGAVAAVVLVLAYSRRVTKRQGVRPPLWFYLGGIPGAFTVMLAAIAVNSRLALSGTIALMLVGQVVFGMVSDYFGLFRTPKRRPVATDLVVALAVLGGSALIIFGA
jgi:bacterial/archaeal transporter family-2 protein